MKGGLTMGMNGMGGLQTIQKILLYTQIVDSYVKLALDICLVIGVIVLIKYIRQRACIEKSKYDCRAKANEAQKIAQDMRPKTVEEEMVNMDI